MKIKYLLLLTILFGCQDINYLQNSIKETEPKLLFQTEWRNENEISIYFDSMAWIYDENSGYMRKHYFKIETDTLTISTRYVSKDTFSDQSSLLRIEKLTKDSLVLSPIRIVDKRDFIEDKKIILKAEKTFQNREIEMDSIQIHGGGWGPEINFKLKKDKVKFHLINREYMGDTPTGKSDTISYYGKINDELIKEFEYLIQVSEVETLKDYYTIISHCPSFNIKLSYNGISKKSHGSTFPRGINKLIERVLSLNEPDFKNK